MKLVGEMRLVVVDKKTGRPLPQQVIKNGILGDTGWEKNMVVETGKEFVLDEVFNSGKWNSAAGISGGALGVSTNTNSGVVGPTEGVPVAVGGAWNGVSEDDWRLSAEMTNARAAIASKARVDQSMEVVIPFTDADLVFDAGVCKIRECGLFLNATTPPSANPQDVPSQKPYAMFARRVYFGTDDPVTPTQYVDRPFYKIEDTNTLLFRYRLTLG